MAKKKEGAGPAEEPQEAPEEPKEEAKEAEPQIPIPEAEVSKDARNMAMLCHLLAIFTSFIAPLIIWLIKKDEEPFVDHQGKEALNFQITVILAMLASCLLSVICVGIPLLIAIPIVDLVLCIIAAVKASSGIAYRYPVSLRLLK